MAKEDSADFYEKTTCRLCGGIRLEPVITLTPTPPGNHFRTADELGQAQPDYPLEVRLCSQCGHIQLGHVVDPRVLYQENYTYVSGTSPVFVQHLSEYAETAIRRLGVRAGHLVVDIGSNDGTGLQFFQEAGCRVLGVDPATNIARRATERGIETIPDFFRSDLALEIRERYGPAKLVTSHNACAHIDDLGDVVRGAEILLSPEGHFVFEVGYFADVFENVWFDTVYHEHLDFHTVAPLIPFLETCGLALSAVERVAPQGGSIRVFSARPGGESRLDDSVDELLELEKSLGLADAAVLRRFEEHIDQVRDRLGEMVRGVRAAGHSIVGYGAPTKATTLLTHFGLEDVLDFIVDDNPLKQNLFSPGHHIPVYAADELYERNPDYVLILAWNFADPIMKLHEAYREAGGRFIVPMPSPRIVE